MIPLRCINNQNISNGNNSTFLSKNLSGNKTKNINLSNLLVCDDQTMIERISLNSGIHSTQRNIKSSKGSSRPKAFSKGDRFKILNQQQFTEQDFDQINHKTMGDESYYQQRFDSNIQYQTNEINRKSKNSNRPISQEMQRMYIKTEENIPSSKNTQQTSFLNTFLNNTPINNRVKPKNIPLINDRIEEQDQTQKLFIKPSYVRQRDYLSIDVRSRKPSNIEYDRRINQSGENLLNQFEQRDNRQSSAQRRRSSNSCMGKYTIDIPQTYPIESSQTIQFQDKGIRSITPSILSTSTHAATLTLNKSFSKARKNLSSSKNSSLTNQSSFKKKLKIFKKENKSPKPNDIIPLSVSSSYSRNIPLRVTKNPDLKVLSILGAYDQQGLGNFMFNKKQFKQFLKNLNFKSAQEEQQMIKYMFIYFKQWQKKINQNIDLIKLQLFSIKVEDLEEESKDIQKYIRKKANQAKRIKKCISVLLNYTKSKRDSRKLKQINQKCSEYDSLLKTINVIHTLKMRVEGYLVNKISKPTPIKNIQTNTYKENQNEQQQQQYMINNYYTNQQLNLIGNDQNNNSNNYQRDSFDNEEQDNYQQIEYNNHQSKRSTIKKMEEQFVHLYEQDGSRAQSRRLNMDLSDDDFNISKSRVNSEGVYLYDKRKSTEKSILQQQHLIDHNQIKVTPANNVTPIRSCKKEDSNFYELSQKTNNNNNVNNNNTDNTSQIQQKIENNTINFQKDVVNIRSLKPISINNEEDQNQKATLNQASIDNMIKNGSTNTNYQGSFMINNNSTDKQTPKEWSRKILTNSKIEEVGEDNNDTPRRKGVEQEEQQISQNSKKQNKKPHLKYESLEKVIKQTIAEQSMSIRHKSIFQNYIDSIKIPLEDLQKQGEDVQQIFEVFNQLMESFEEKIKDHAQNCVELNKWDILLQYLRDFSQLIDESVRLGSELMKVSQSKALPLTVTNRAVVYLQEAQQKYREVSGKVKDSLKELVNHMWELIEEGIHLNSSDRQYEEVFKFMADIRDSVKQSQVNDYQNKEKLAIIDEVAKFLNELYKVQYKISTVVHQKELIFVDSPSFKIIKDIKSHCHEFKSMYKNMMQRLDEIMEENNNNTIHNFNRESLKKTANQRKSMSQSSKITSSIPNENSILNQQSMGERRGSHGQLIGMSLIEKQCEEIEDLFEINKWFITKSQDIDNLVIFEDPAQIINTYSMNEEGRKYFFNEISIGVGVLLQLRENAEDIVDISASQNLSTMLKNVKIAQEKYTQIADIALIAAELCNLQYFNNNNLDNSNQESQKQLDQITQLYEIIDKLKVQNIELFQQNIWLHKFLNRLINGTLYFDFFVNEYPYMCENMHNILTEYSSRTKYSIPSTEQFYKIKSSVQSKIEKVRNNKNLSEDSVGNTILMKMNFLEERVAFAVNLFGSHNYVLPNGSLLCKILEAFFERIVHAKPFNKLSEQFEKLRAFMQKGIEIICQEKEVICSKKDKNEQSTSTASQSSFIEQEIESKIFPERKTKQQSFYIPLNKNSHIISHSTAATSGFSSTSNAQSIIKPYPHTNSKTPTSSAIKNIGSQPLKELRFENEEGSISTQGKSVLDEKIDKQQQQQFTGRVKYYDNILEEAESLCKQCALFVPSKGDENSKTQNEGDYLQNFSISVYEEFIQLCSRYLLAKRDRVNIYSNTQLRVKWISPYNEQQSIFQQKYSFIEKYILNSEQNSSQENVIEYSKHINQIFHKNGPIFYKYDFMQFTSYLQLFIESPTHNFQVLITLENDPSTILYQGNLENQKISTNLPINDIFANVKMTLLCRDLKQSNDPSFFLKSARQSIDNQKFSEIKEYENEQQQQQIKNQDYIVNQNQSQKLNSTIKTSIIQDKMSFLRHKSSHIFLMRAQKITQLRISNLNYNVQEEELFKIFYRSNQTQSLDKSSILQQKKIQLEVFAIINESEVVFRRKNISNDKNIILSQNSPTIQEWTITTGYLQTINPNNNKIIDFYVKINSLDEGSFYIYDKNNYYVIKSSLLLKQEEVLSEAGVNGKVDQYDKEQLIQSINKLLPDKYWHAFSIIDNNQFVERSRLTSQPHLLKNLS